MSSNLRILSVLTVLSGLLLGGLALHARAEGEKGKDEEKKAEGGLSADYGFLAAEVFKLSPRIAHLTARDLNGDGQKDLVVVDNGNSRIDVLLARKKPDEKGEQATDKVEVNDLKSSWRFEHKKISVPRKIDSLVICDFNGDGKQDICYLGDNHLAVLAGDETGKFAKARDRRISDQALPFPWRAAVGDVDGDGCEDIVTLGDGETLIFRGSPDGSLDKVDRLPNTSNKFSFLWVRDFNGDGRLDIVALSDEDPERALMVRFQDATKQFGPEYRLEVPIPRAFDLAELDSRPGSEFLAIDKANRVKMYRVNPAPDKRDSPTSPLVQYGFGPRKSAGLGSLHLATGDINGDGRLDVVTVDGDAALMNVYLQDPKTGLGHFRAYPGLTGIRGVVLADVDGDKQAEVIMVSDREKIVAISRWKDGRLTFPEALPTVDTPLALCMADFDGSGKQEIAYIASSRASGSASYALRKLTFKAGMGWQPGEFGGMDDVPLDKLRGAPVEMLAVDADRDGRSDLLIIGNNTPLVFMATDARGVPQAADAASNSRLGNVLPGRVTVGQLDGPAILVAEKNFTRRMRLDPKSGWNVVDQYNAENPEAVIAGTVILDLDGDGKSEIVLVDTGTKRLRFLKQKEGVYRPWKDLETGTLLYQSVFTGDFNGDGKSDLLLFGVDRFAVAYTGQSGPVLEQVGSFETQLREARPSDLIVGDLGGGKELEIALADHQKHRIEIITPRDGEWKSAMNFKVFETGQANAAGAEPREMVVADVTGDGLDDLIMIVHDRILVFPQDAGPKETGDEKEKGKE